VTKLGRHSPASRGDTTKDLRFAILARVDGREKQALRRDEPTLFAVSGLLGVTEFVGQPKSRERWRATLQVCEKAAKRVRPDRALTPSGCLGR
jgi:hypothetical protein